MERSLRLISTAVLTLMSAMFALQALAQRLPARDRDSTEFQEQQPIADETVIVRGRRLGELEFNIHDYVRQFVDEVAAPSMSRGLARWNQRSLCAGVSNLDRQAAQYLLDRIALLASDVGLEPGEPGCRPQVYIIFTVDASELATVMVENHWRVFRPAGGDGDMTLSRTALDEFSKSDKAVRWWHVSVPVGTMARASRISSGVRDDLLYSIVIVDGTKLTGMSWQMIGDFLALISLAQIDPNAKPSAYDSILNVFDNPAAYSGLTAWDRSYIEGLYSIDQERMPRLQRNVLVSEIARQERDQRIDME